jgi:hypothetical protein
MAVTTLVSVHAEPEPVLAELPVERLEAETVGWNAQLNGTGALSLCLSATGCA